MSEGKIVLSRDNRELLYFHFYAPRADILDIASEEIDLYNSSIFEIKSRFPHLAPVPMYKCDFEINYFIETLFMSYANKNRTILG